MRVLIDELLSNLVRDPRRPSSESEAAEDAPARDSLSTSLYEQPDLCSSVLDALGLALLKRGHHVEAEPLISRALDIRGKYFGMDHPMYAASLHNSALVLLEAGNYTDAAEKVRQALHIHQRVVGADRLSMASMLNTLARVELNQGHYVEAEHCARQALEIVGQMNVDSDPLADESLAVLAKLQLARGDVSAAREMYVQLLRRVELRYGRDHPTFATYLADCTAVEAANGDLHRALAMLETALRILEVADHPALSDALVQRAQTLLQIGDLELARADMEQAMTMHRKVLGPEHVVIGLDFVALGHIEQAMGHSDVAERCYSTALETLERNVTESRLCPEHPGLADARASKGALLAEIGDADRTAESETLLRSASRVYEEQVGTRSPQYASATLHLGRALFLQGKDLVDARRMMSDSVTTLANLGPGWLNPLHLGEIWLREFGSEAAPREPYNADTKGRVPGGVDRPAKGEVQFTARYPRTIALGQRRKLLAYVHLASAWKAVADDASMRLGPEERNAGEMSASSLVNLPPDSRITIRPTISSCLIEPEDVNFRWREDWHVFEFKVHLDRKAHVPKGAVLKGEVEFYLGPVLLSVVPISTRVGELPLGEESSATTTRKAFEKIFASYSHADAAVVKRVEGIFAAFGSTYYRDASSLQSGEIWCERLLELIDEADVFHLFWSESARSSQFVEQEWRHALKRSGLRIKPVYWTTPMPKAPSELETLHFKFAPELSELAVPERGEA